MYPFKFYHIYFETVWGGLSTESFRDDLPEGFLGHILSLPWKQRNN